MILGGRVSSFLQAVVQQSKKVSMIYGNFFMI